MVLLTPHRHWRLGLGHISGVLFDFGIQDCSSSQQDAQGLDREERLVGGTQQGTSASGAGHGQTELLLGERNSTDSQRAKFHTNTNRSNARTSHLTSLGSYQPKIPLEMPLLHLSTNPLTYSLPIVYTLATRNKKRPGKNTRLSPPGQIGSKVVPAPGFRHGLKKPTPPPPRPIKKRARRPLTPEEPAAREKYQDAVLRMLPVPLPFAPSSLLRSQYLFPCPLWPSWAPVGR